MPYTRQLLKKRERLVKTDLFQVLEEVVNESSTHAEESTVQYDRVWLHCSVGEALETGESEKVQVRFNPSSSNSQLTVFTASSNYTITRIR